MLATSAEARALADLDLAERLGRAAVAAGGGVAATVDLVETLYWRGEHGEVIALIESAQLASAPADFAANGAKHMAQSLFWGRGDLDHALPWIAKGIEWGGPSWEGILRGKQALMLNNAGRTVDAIAEGYTVISLADASPVARLAGYSGLLPSLTVAGRLTELDEHLPLAQALIAEEPPGFSDVADGTLVATFIGGLFEGRLPEIDPMLEVFDEDALQRVDDPYRGMWAFLHGGLPSRKAGSEWHCRCCGRPRPCCVAAILAVSSVVSRHSARRTAPPATHNVPPRRWPSAIGYIFP